MKSFTRRENKYHLLKHPKSWCKVQIWGQSIPFCDHLYRFKYAQIVGPQIAEVRSDPQRRRCIMKFILLPSIVPLTQFVSPWIPGLKLSLLFATSLKVYVIDASLFRLSWLVCSEFCDSASQHSTNQQPSHSLPGIPRTLPSMPNSASDLRLVVVRVSKGRWGSVSSAP